MSQQDAPVLKARAMGRMLRGNCSHVCPDLSALSSILCILCTALGLASAVAHAGPAGCQAQRCSSAGASRMQGGRWSAGRGACSWLHSANSARKRAEPRPHPRAAICSAISSEQLAAASKPQSSSRRTSASRLSGEPCDVYFVCCAGCTGLTQWLRPPGGVVEGRATVPKRRSCRTRQLHCPVLTKPCQQERVRHA